jgi:uncharacterized membrane protein (DUF2068 family)
MVINRKVVYFTISYILSRMIFLQLNYRYNLFIEGFETSKFIIDIGVFGVIYLLVNIIGNRVNQLIFSRKLGGRNESTD